MSAPLTWMYSERKMEQFLQETKAKLHDLSSHDKIHVVIGNEACDLDSTVSAVTYAWFLAKTRSSTQDVVFIPVLNIPQEDYRLRTEVTYFLRRLGITDTSLVFRDNIDLRDLHSQGKLSLTLVDQNVLPQKDTDLESIVVEVIDHHSNQRGDGDDNCSVTIEMVGSCATLVAEKMKSTNGELFTEEISTLLLGTILLDTVNFDPAAGKTTFKDEQIAVELQEHCPNVDKTELFESLQSAKCDMSGLQTSEILRKDLKCVCNDAINIGISSVTMHLETFLERDNIMEDLGNFCTSQNIDMLVVMAITIDEEITRQLAIFTSHHPGIKQDLIFTLECSISPDLDLSPMVTEYDTMATYYQGNIKASRKKILPIVKEFLDNMDTSKMKKIALKTPDSETMDMSSDTSGKESALLDFSSSSPSTSTNTPMSPEQTADLFGLDSLTTTTTSTHAESENDNTNNNADFDPFGNEFTSEFINPTITTSDQKTLDSLVDLEPDVVASPNKANNNLVEYDIFASPAQQPNQDLFGLDDFTQSNTTKDDYLSPSDPFASGDPVSSQDDASNLVDLLQPEGVSGSVPISIPGRLSGNPNENMNLSPLIPLTPQNSFAELSELEDGRERILDLCNPDIANAVNERLRQVENDGTYSSSIFETENNHNSDNPVHNPSNAENVVFTKTSLSATEIDSNVVANVLANDMTVDGDDRIDFTKKEINDDRMNIVASMLATEACDVTDRTQFAKRDINNQEMIRDNVVAKILASDMENGEIGTERITFVTRNIDNQDMISKNVVAKILARDMETDATQSFRRQGNQLDSDVQSSNIVAKMLASDMGDVEPEISFVESRNAPDNDIQSSNIVANMLADDMVGQSEISFPMKEDLFTIERPTANIVAQVIVDDLDDISVNRTEEINDVVENQESSITFQKNDSSGANIVAETLADDMARDVDAENGTSFINRDINDMTDSNIVAGVFADEMNNDKNVEFTFAEKNTDERDNVVAKVFAEDMMNDIVHENNEEFTFTERNIAEKDNVVAKVFAEDMMNNIVHENNEEFTFTEKNIAEKDNVVAKVFAADMMNDIVHENNEEFTFTERNIAEKDNVVAKVFAEDMINDINRRKGFNLPKNDISNIVPSARTTNVAAYMLAYTSFDETGNAEITANGESPNDGDQTNGDQSASNDGISPDSRSFVPIDESASSSGLTVADIEQHQESYLYNKRVSSPSGESESQTSGDDVSTTSGSFTCNDMPSPLHRPITSIAETDEPISSEEEHVAMETITKEDVIESDIMEPEDIRVVIGQEAEEEIITVEVRGVSESVPDTPQNVRTLSDKDQNRKNDMERIVENGDMTAEVKQAVKNYVDRYEDEDEYLRNESGRRVEESIAKASPRKKRMSDASMEAEKRMAGIKLNEEWQDDDEILTHHAMIGEDWGDDVIQIDPMIPVPPKEDEHAIRPATLELGAKPKTKKKVTLPAELMMDDNDDTFSFDLERIDDIPTPDMRTPSLRDDSSLLMTSGEMEWEDDTPLPKTTSSEAIPEYTAEEEMKDSRQWRVVEIGGRGHSMDMKVINPYKKVLSHGGYYGDGLNAIIVFAACYLPEKTRKDYNYVMENLFLYVISTLDLLVAQDYMMVYFHGGCNKYQAPNLGWLKRCYKMIDRRLRKNLKGLLLVHPNFWLKTVVRFSRPFISSKFIRKLRFVSTLAELKQLVPLEYVYIPDQVKKFDDKKRKKKVLSEIDKKWLGLTEKYWRSFKNLNKRRRGDHQLLLEEDLSLQEITRKQNQIQLMELKKMLKRRKKRQKRVRKSSEVTDEIELWLSDDEDGGGGDSKDWFDDVDVEDLEAMTQF
ncbi:uncharacterized protein LOC144450158 [Glandiceps talaboti]